MGVGFSTERLVSEPVNLIRVSEKPEKNMPTFVLNEELAQLLNNPEMRDLPVAVISVAGLAKTGKSFLMAFFLKYAATTYLISTEPPPEDWMLPDENVPGGFELLMKAPTTRGIAMWPRLFKALRGDGTVICFFLIDTQGTYDSDSASAIWASVFAMSSLMSSLQLYNVEEEITEEDLQSLELYVGYMHLYKDLYALEDRPGQNLMFLIRDYKCDRDKKGFGLEESEAYFANKMRNPEVLPEHKEVRDRIQAAYDNVNCFTLPYPGRAVAEKRVFTGTVNDIDAYFLKVAKYLVEYILHSDNLVPKRVAGVVVTCAELYSHIKLMMKHFNGHPIPVVVSPFTSLVVIDHLAAREAAYQFYVLKMKNCGGGGRFVDEKYLEKSHKKYLEEAIQMYNERPKYGVGEGITHTQLANLKLSIEEKYQEYSAQNSTKFLAVYNQLPIWSILCLCGLVVIEEKDSYKATKYLKLILMARLFFWLARFYPRRIYGEDY